LDEVVDAEVLEKYLPSIQHLRIPFLLPLGTDPALVQSGFFVRYESPSAIRNFIRSTERSLIF
jgi:hypothetical protein